MPTKLLTLTEDEIGEHFWIEGSVRPKLPQDKLILSQIAQALRTPGADGKPSMSDEDIGHYVFEWPYPDQVKKNVDFQMFEAQSQEVQQMIQVGLLEKWKKANKPTVDAYEKAMQPDEQFKKMRDALTPETMQQLIEAGALMKHAEMMGVDPQQMMQQMAQASAMQDSAAQAQSLVPGTVAPPQMGGQPQQPPQPVPGAMPPQMMMGNSGAQTGVVPEMQVAEQMRRAPKAQPHKTT